MREIVLDTETTGLEAENGDRIVEIGCVETWNNAPTGVVFHEYLNPEKPMSSDSIRITGLTDEFLRDKPVFKAIARKFIDFIGDAPLVIHNASFDMRFLNAELGRLGVAPLSQARVVDTLAMAKKRFPGAQVSLDALCRRFSVDNSVREKHGALLDAELLAEVYLELRGGRQPGLALSAGPLGQPSQASAGHTEQGDALSGPRPPRRSRLTEAEAAAHDAFIRSLGPEVLWPTRETATES